jgi:VWFA-related protein
VLLPGFVAIAAPPAGRSWQIQQSPGQAVFRTRVDLVRIPVAVIEDKTQRALSDLTQRDFQIFENGVQQEITAFTGPDAAPAEESAKARARTLLLVFGHGRLEGPMRPFEGAAQFVREQLRPGDAIAILAFNRVSAILRDRELAARIVERLKAERDSLMFDLNVVDPQSRHLRSTDISAALQQRIDAVLTPEGRQDLRPRNATALVWGTDEFRRNEQFWPRWDRWLISRDVLKIHAGLEYLRDIEGDRHLVLLTRFSLGSLPSFIPSPEGLSLDSREDDARLAARANDAGVRLHVINTFGTLTGPSFAYVATRNMASLAGGWSTSLYTAAEAFDTIDDLSRSTFILGYMPANRAMDGRQRAISVKVARKGVTVVHPHTYTARADLPPLNAREVATRERLRDAAAMDIPQEDIKLDAKAALARGSAGERQVRVDLRIDASKLALRPVDGRHEGVIDLMILCGDEQRQVVCSLSQQMTLSMDEARYRQAMASGIPYATTVPATGAATLVKVIVYDYDADVMGVANVRVR